MWPVRGAGAGVQESRECGDLIVDLEAVLAAAPRLLRRPWWPQGRRTAGQEAGAAPRGFRGAGSDRTGVATRV